MKCCQFAASAPTTNTPKNSSERTLNGLCARAAARGNQCATLMPSTAGMPSRTTIVTSTSSGSSATAVRMRAVSGFRLPQNARFSGVKSSEPSVEIDVIVIDSAVLPRAKWVRKFEMLPPGQAATRISPSAMLGAGFSTIPIPQPTAGSSTNWPSMPISVARGALLTPLKSDTFMSSATPNSTSARIAFRTPSDCGLKLSRTRSISLIGRGSAAPGLFVHLLEVDQAGRPHVLDRVDVDVDQRAPPRSDAALERRLELARVGDALAVRAHRLREPVELDFAQVRLDRLVGAERLHDHGLQRLEHEL